MSRVKSIDLIAKLNQSWAVSRAKSDEFKRLTYLRLKRSWLNDHAYECKKVCLKEGTFRQAQ